MGNSRKTKLQKKTNGGFTLERTEIFEVKDEKELKNILEILERDLNLMEKQKHQIEVNISNLMHEKQEIEKML